MSKIKMVCLILGGGAGSRLYPLTKHRSKPAVPIGGKYRLIDIPISNCINSGVKRIFVLTQFNSASLNRHIKNTYQFDVFHGGFVDILAAEQTPNNPNWFQGTADAVRQSMHHLSNHDFDYLLVLSGDQLYQMDFEAMARHHIQTGAELTIATKPVNAREAPEFGVMKVDASGLIARFIEKPKPDLLPEWRSDVPPTEKRRGRHWLASMGIYIFNRAAIEKLFADHPEATDFGKEIIPASINKGYRVASYPFGGYWTDIGNIRSFFEANLELTDNLPPFNLFDNHKLTYTRARMLAPAKIHGTRLNRALISEGCIIHAKRIERSVIGIRSRIGTNTVITNSIVMGNDYYQTLEEIVLKEGEIPMGIGKNCHIDHAIIDKDCRIGNHVTIRGGEGLANVETDTYCIVDGIVVLKKLAVVPDGTHIGKP
jgi:glucose-1-phosphate adenylyltransferase